MDAVCVGLRNIESVHLDRLPRMADFAKFALTAETGLGYEPGNFTKPMRRTSGKPWKAASKSILWPRPSGN
ncbi:MAG: hypothetical protein ACE15F_04120 [bacterium]